MARGTRKCGRACAVAWLLVQAGCADLLALEPAAPIPSMCLGDRDCPPDWSCSNSQCISQTCAPAGRKQCNGLERRTCGDDGKWLPDPVKCPSACEVDQCVEARSCELLDQCFGLSCCDSILVEQHSFQLHYGTLERIGDKLAFPARHVSRSVRPFSLDRFEVTVGRFNAFVADYEAARRPLPGAGKHPGFADSGWQERWNDAGGPLPQNIGDLVKALRARGERLSTDGDQKLPVRGVSWHLAAAFCVWDGGRLATEAEWAYAASGGDERDFPWPADTDPLISPDRAVYTGDGVTHDQPTAVGEHPNGRGPLGHEDLAGNVKEWVADVYVDPLPAMCHGPSDATIDPFECLQRGADDADRVLRGGAFHEQANQLRNVRRRAQAPYEAESDFGIRCARDLPAIPR